MKKFKLLAIMAMALTITTAVCGASESKHGEAADGSRVMVDQSSHLVTLNPNVLMIIASCLTPEEAMRLMLTCKPLYDTEGQAIRNSFKSYIRKKDRRRVRKETSQKLQALICTLPFDDDAWNKTCAHARTFDIDPFYLTHVNERATPIHETVLHFAIRATKKDPDAKAIHAILKYFGNNSTARFDFIKQYNYQDPRLVTALHIAAIYDNSTAINAMYKYLSKSQRHELFNMIDFEARTAWNIIEDKISASDTSVSRETLEALSSFNDGDFSDDTATSICIVS